MPGLLSPHTAAGGLGQRLGTGNFACELGRTDIAERAPSRAAWGPRWAGIIGVHLRHAPHDARTLCLLCSLYARSTLLDAHANPSRRSHQVLLVTRMTSSGVLKPLSSLKVHGGRSSVSGATVTVFGAAGFIGRYVVNRLGKMGCRVVVPYRGDELHVRHLKPMGDLGVINPMAMSIRNLDEIETAVAGSNVVINLLGKHFETRRAPA